MILVTHPRSGSEWFFDCLQDSTFVRWEIFGDLDRQTDTTFPMPTLGLGAKERILRTAPPGKSHKIMLYRFWDESPPESLVQHLRARQDVYLLRRRNTRAAIISLFVGVNNDLNFHADPTKLNTSFTLTKDQLVRWAYRMHGIFEDPARSLGYKEVLWYEDLLAGNYPLTLRFENRSTRPIRRSAELGLVQNIEQVNEWFNELQIPGSIDHVLHRTV